MKELLQDFWKMHRSSVYIVFGVTCFLLVGLLAYKLPSLQELPVKKLSQNKRSEGATPSSVTSTQPKAQTRKPELRVVTAERDLANNSSSDKTTEWFLYITGSVRSPGVYKLSPGARLFNLVDAAGGLLSFADAVAINLASPLSDGMHVHVPRKADRTSTSVDDVAVILAPNVEYVERKTKPKSVNKQERIDVNSASVEELTRLKGIGKFLARRIVEYREQMGKFKTLDELTLVRGIGAVKLQGLRDQATVGF